MLRTFVLCLIYLKSVRAIEEDISDTNSQELVKFHLFNRLLGTRGVHIGVGNSSEYLKEIFIASCPMKLVVHGWLGSEDTSIVENITSVYLKERDVNSIRVDWSLLANSFMYPISAFHVETVGEIIAQCLDHLVSSGVVTLDSLHLIGHSLGAHVVGTAGEKMKKGKPARITGLDPARPGFEILGDISSGILEKTDGRFVDVIHTAGGVAGYLNPLGHVDFYPNEGVPPQPGCGHLTDPFKMVRCSHGRSYEFYAESIVGGSRKFKSVQCKDWPTFLNGSCRNNKVAYMGDSVSKRSRGIFYLHTNPEPPYSIVD